MAMLIGYQCSSLRVQQRINCLKQLFQHLLPGHDLLTSHTPDCTSSTRHSVHYHCSPPHSETAFTHATCSTIANITDIIVNTAQTERAGNAAAYRCCFWKKMKEWLQHAVPCDREGSWFDMHDYADSMLAGKLQCTLQCTADSFGKCVMWTHHFSLHSAIQDIASGMWEYDGTKRLWKSLSPLCNVYK